MKFLAAVVEVQRMGRETRQSKADHRQPADPAAPQKAPQLETKGDEIARQKTNDGYVKHALFGKKFMAIEKNRPIILVHTHGQETGHNSMIIVFTGGP